MKDTWASGAIELLKHADSHIESDSAFDKRIAFISIDNCVETSIRTFLSLPESKSNVHVSKKELDDASNSFPKLLALLYKSVPHRLVGIDDGDIEHYHRIRNKLYHEGTGLSVDDQYLKAYRSIAALLLENLFDVKYSEPIIETPTLEMLILNFNRVDKLIKAKLEDNGISGTYKWEEAFAHGLFDKDDINLITEFRIARNRLVHSDSLDRNEIKAWVEKSYKLVRKLTEAGSTHSSQNELAAKIKAPETSAQSNPLDEPKIKILKLLFSQNMSTEQLADALGLQLQAAAYHLEDLASLGMVILQRYSKSVTSYGHWPSLQKQRFSAWTIRQSGRKYLIANKLVEA